MSLDEPQVLYRNEVSPSSTIQGAGGSGFVDVVLWLNSRIVGNLTYDCTPYRGYRSVGTSGSLKGIIGGPSDGTVLCSTWAVTHDGPGVATSGVSGCEVHCPSLSCDLSNRRPDSLGFVTLCVGLSVDDPW